MFFIIRFFLLALLPLLFNSEGSAGEMRKGFVSFPHRESDISRITSFEVLCKGGRCDEKYIQQNLRNIERHLRIASDLLRPKGYTGLPAPKLTVRVVPISRIRMFLRAPKEAIPQGIVLEGEPYTLYVYQFAPVKGDEALNLILQHYVRVIYAGLHGGTVIPPDEFTHTMGEIIYRGKNTIDVSFLK